MSTNLTLLTLASADSYELTAGGWVIMVLSVGFVTLLLAWCVSRVLRESSPQKLHSQVDIEPPDEAKAEQ